MVTKSPIRLRPNLLYGPILFSITVSSLKNTIDDISLTKRKNRENLNVMFAF